TVVTEEAATFQAPAVIVILDAADGSALDPFHQCSAFRTRKGSFSQLFNVWPPSFDGGDVFIQQGVSALYRDIAARSERAGLCQQRPGPPQKLVWQHRLEEYQLDFPLCLGRQVLEGGPAQHYDRNV